MSGTVSLRAVAVIALLLAMGHTAGYPWTPANDPDSLATVAGMRFRCHGPDAQLF
jgi:hypothetical protein